MSMRKMLTLTMTTMKGYKMSIRISLLTLAMAMVVGLGFVSSAQAAIYSQDFEGLTDGLLAGQDSWTGAGANVGVGAGGGINGTSGIFIAEGSSATPSTARQGAIPAGSPFVQFRALVNVSLSSNAIVQMNMMEEGPCCAAPNQRVEVGISQGGFAFYAGSEFSVSSSAGTNGWIEVQLEYNQGTGPSDQGTMDVSWRDVDDTTGAALEAFQLVGSFVPSGNKTGDLDWDAGMVSFSFRADKAVSYGAAGNGAHIDNVQVIIPEPTTLVMLAMAVPPLLFLLSRRRRRARN